MNQSALHQISRAQAQALAMTAQQMLNETRNDQVMPFDTGNLQNESSFVDDKDASRGKASIVHDTPYARRLYYHPEYNFRTDKNPNARGEWWEDWLTGSKRGSPMTLFKQFLKRLSGGYVK
jgi:hypothetical protein